MKGWFAIRIVPIMAVTLLIFYVLNYMVIFNLTFPPVKIHPFTLVLVMASWAVGLVTIKFQFGKLPHKQEQDPQEKKDWKDRFLPGKKEDPVKRESQTLGEIVKNSHKTSSPLMSMPSTDGSQIHNNGVEIGKVVEGVLESSLADAELSMELELPEGTKLNVFGQEVTVKKGRIKVKPRRTKKQTLETMFPGHRKRPA